LKGGEECYREKHLSRKSEKKKCSKKRPDKRGFYNRKEKVVRGKGGRVPKLRSG